MTLDISGIKIKWLGHDAFRLDFLGKTIYIDPFQIHEKDKASLVLITHGHYDHFSPDDLKKIADAKTIIVGTVDVIEKLQIGEARTVAIGDSIDAAGVHIKAVAAYNLEKPFHPKQNGWVGYVFELGGIKFYHSGDTDFIPEMEDISADVAFLPVSGTYVMGPKEAAAAARKIMPKVAIPMHYGSLVGTKKDAEEFKKLCDFCRVEII
jgi:L-ascorbate metabolism protein UlaG (beta-lactamase superfamily)